MAITHRFGRGDGLSPLATHPFKLSKFSAVDDTEVCLACLVPLFIDVKHETSASSVLYQEGDLCLYKKTLVRTINAILRNYP